MLKKTGMLVVLFFVYSPGICFSDDSGASRAGKIKITASSVAVNNSEVNIDTGTLQAADKNYLKEIAGLVNLTKTVKGIKAEGWGEYKGAGRCLCCDNILDGDCVSIDNIERTEKQRLPQIMDGNEYGDDQDEKSFFGNVKKRKEDKYVSYMYVKIMLPREKGISKVIVFGVKRKNRFALTNCELGYIDQFDRLKWLEKIDDNTGRYMVFDLDPVITVKNIMLRIKGGQSKLAEVQLFGQK